MVQEDALHAHQIADFALQLALACAMLVNLGRSFSQIKHAQLAPYRTVERAPAMAHARAVKPDIRWTRLQLRSLAKPVQLTALSAMQILANVILDSVRSLVLLI
jgi:hypothetical protein